MERRGPEMRLVAAICMRGLRKITIGRESG
jgi:hypothetical protein